MNPYVEALSEHDYLLWQLEIMKGELDKRTPMDAAIDKVTGREADWTGQAKRMMKRVDKLNVMMETAR
jgi:hypothetical protein